LDGEPHSGVIRQPCHLVVRESTSLKAGALTGAAVGTARGPHSGGGRSEVDGR
jgi:hypothetical protein